MNDRIRAMEKIFSPRSIAFVGASNKRMKWGGIVFRNLRKGGYEGEIYPVNPGEQEIQGYKAYPDVSSIPADVDLAIFTIPAHLVPEAISDCVRKGVGAGVVITAGFSELGPEGRVLQDEMIRRAKAGGMVLVGPNGQGIAVPENKLYPWLPIFRPAHGSVGIASQSGNVSTALAEQLAELGFGCSKVISAGNCADLGWGDYLGYFAADPDTQVVLLYIEGIEDGRKFFESAKKASLAKPIVLLKGGRTEAGTRAAASHTGVMAGSDHVFSSLCRQAGIVRAETAEQAAILAAAFVSTSLPAGRRLGIVTGGGGYGVLSADAAAKRGLNLVRLSDATVEKLRKHLPPWWSPNNPVDMVGNLGAHGGPMDLIPILMESGEVDGVIFLSAGWLYNALDPVYATRDFRESDRKDIQFLVDRDVDFCQKLADYATSCDKPLLIHSPVARLAVRRRYPGLLRIIERRIVLYPEIDDAVQTFSLLAERQAFLAREARGG
ncbi:MAG: CoA-binding protein [bacterium]